MKSRNKLILLSLLGILVLISTIIVSLLFYFDIFNNSSTNDLVVSLYKYSSIEEAFKDNNWFGMYLTIGIGSAILLLIILIIIFVCLYKSKKKRIEKNKRTSSVSSNTNNLIQTSSSNMELPLNDDSNFFENYSKQTNPTPIQKTTTTKKTTISTTKSSTPIVKKPATQVKTTTTTTKKVVKKSSLGSNSNK